MRIRKRPFSSSSYASPSPTSLPPSPDLPHRVPHPNGSGLGARVSSGGGPAEAKQELHQDGDLPIGRHGLDEIAPSTMPIHLHHSDPCADAKSRRRRRCQVPMNEGEEWLIESNKWKVQNGSSIRKSGSSGAVGSAATQLVEQEKKNEVKERTFPNGASNNRTSAYQMEADHKEECDGGPASPHPMRAGANGKKGRTSRLAVVMEETDHKEECDGGPASPHPMRAGANGKKGRTSRPAVVMEGSRCSRVNGRGWRCCQPTLVGYSLCEHHLGKGRLRSVSTAVRGQLGTSKPKWRTTDGIRNGRFVVSSIPPQQQEEEEEQRQRRQALHVADSGADKAEGEEDQRLERKKTKKIGAVKARSISSLLDNDHLIAVKSLL